jgi:hypothetical protein
MKYFFAILISMTISLSSLSAVYANDVMAEDTDVVTAKDSALLDNLPVVEDDIDIIYAERINKFIKSLEASNEASDETVSIKGSAPALTYLEVTGAVSTNSGGSIENFSVSQWWSELDHGGAELYIRTKEIGIGFSPVARMDGNRLTQVLRYAITNTSGVVVGYLRWWDASGYEGGKFTYQNRSTNYPGNLIRANALKFLIENRFAELNIPDI